MELHGGERKLARGSVWEEKGWKRELSGCLWGGGGYGAGGGALAVLGKRGEVGELRHGERKLTMGLARAEVGRKKGLRGELEGEAAMAPAAPALGRGGGEVGHWP